MKKTLFMLCLSFIAVLGAMGQTADADRIIGTYMTEGGKAKVVIDPENGKTYSCKITLKNNGDLTVRGFIGVSLLGRNTTWKRLK